MFYRIWHSTHLLARPEPWTKFCSPFGGKKWYYLWVMYVILPKEDFRISVLASTRQNAIPYFLHTCGTIYCWETGVYISAFYKVLLQLKLHWACDFFSTYSTNYLAWHNKRFCHDFTQKITRLKTLHTHTTHNTTHKNKMYHCLPTPSGFALYLHGNICHGPKSWGRGSPRVCCRHLVVGLLSLWLVPLVGMPNKDASINREGDRSLALGGCLFVCKTQQSTNKWRQQ